MKDWRSGRRPAGAVLALALLAGAVSCGDDGAGSAPPGAPFQRVLDRQAAAVRDGDEGAYLATVAPGSRDHGRQVFRNLRRLPLATWTYDVTGVTGTTVEARLRYRLKGYDRATTSAVEKLTFSRKRGTWRVEGEAPGSARQLWEQGAMSVVRGARSLVLGVGRERSELRRLARTADAAVPAVQRHWPRAWSRRLVLEAPSSVKDLARLLGESPSAYAGIAAVTTGEASGKGEPDAPSDRVLINPEAYAALSAEGRQIVTTHEAVHVATRRQTTPATPMWLSEGIADWAAYRDSGQGPRQAAPELAGADGPPRALPRDEDFRFGSGSDRLSRAYEGSWLACRMIAERWGEKRLLALYARVGEGERGGTDRALRSVLGIGEAEFTARWRAYVEDEVG
ncbi:hypothetical protein GCM10009801_35650 [Streptomyces albiaxialis]|uniref:Lipoprotein n=1 Tax=Streptomyces albiaxialis TaxID=329523 RepID=A0ABN2W009_9ACTN